MDLPVAKQPLTKLRRGLGLQAASSGLFLRSKYHWVRLLKCGPLNLIFTMKCSQVRAKQAQGSRRHNLRKTEEGLGSVE